MNVQRLMQAVVTEAQKFGLVALHQIRFRVARQEGHGQFDLLYNETAATNVAESPRFLSIILLVLKWHG